MEDRFDFQLNLAISKHEKECPDFQYSARCYNDDMVEAYCTKCKEGILKWKPDKVKKVVDIWKMDTD